MVRRMQRSPRDTTRVITPSALFAAAALLAGCGGGGSDAPPAPGGATCSVLQEQTWLRGYMADWYLWSGLAPNPVPDAFATVSAYFDALKFGGNATIPADRWSYSQTTASFNQFFAEGQTLGYGIFVNGIEHQLPLRLRYTEPQGPAARAGLARGDLIVSINGRPAADVIADDIATGRGFDALSPAREGDVLTLVVDSGAGPRSVTLTAATYTLTPVPLAPTVFTASGGTKLGYLVLKDFITQAEAPLAAALAAIRAAGATELIVDLRYNGGGRVSTAQQLASLIAGGGANTGRVFTTLSYNAAHQGSNSVLRFGDPGGAPFARVFVLTGARTCSASELLVNGLKPVTNVVTIGATTCGKPVGFNPTAACGNTYSAVTFESVNGAGVGGYFDGLAPSCALAEDFTGALGSAGEKLTAAALGYVASGSCPVAATAPDKSAAAALRRRAQSNEAGERRGMWAD